jgi:UDPglucose 6-dehydrogenase
MSVESAEMTKHALNAFLAVSVAFANELAVLAEQVGADAKQVERGLKTESRIGPRAYLSPGAAFAGGTLARDMAFLTALGVQHGLPTPLLAGVRASNDAHKHWPRRRLAALLGPLAGRRVAVWGLTYKPGTDTLRRSLAVELCRWLVEQGAQVHAHDPAVKALPPGLEGVALVPDPLAALAAAEALVVATEWPDYKILPAEALVAAMARPLVLDANRALAATLGADPRVEYVSVGQGVR